MDSELTTKRFLKGLAAPRVMPRKAAFGATQGKVFLPA